MAKQVELKIENESPKRQRKNFGHFIPDVKDKPNEKGNYIISTLGYQSTDEKIKAMTMAGINLALVRGNFQSDIQEVQEKIDKGEFIEPDNLSMAKNMEIQDKLEIARLTKTKLEKYRARLDAEQKKMLEERTQYMEKMTKEYEAILAERIAKDKKEKLAE